MNRLLTRFVDGPPAVGLLILRVVAGAGLMLHGWSKIQTPFAWMGPHASTPGPIQALAALGEFGGGFLMILGLITPLGAFGALCVMIGAWALVHRGMPWINPKGKSFELASLYGLIALTLLFTGPGRFSLDAMLFGRGRKG
jgi:putative oxidoreductase